MKKLFSIIALLTSTFVSAQNETPNIVIVVIDGARATEAFQDTSYVNVPKMHQLFSEKGTVFSNFKNNGVTNTCPGHTAITTGVYQKLDNTGLELPDNPSVFQYYLKQTGAPRQKAWIVTSKGKLEVLANTIDSDWHGQFKPKYSCGAGRGSYRDDKLTLQKAEEIISTHQPKLMLVQFKEPDISGHRNNWNAYLQGLQTSDSLTVALWDFVQQQPGYVNNTIMLVTNDHGRHTRHFAHHGDDCDGCRSIFLLAIGKNIPAGKVVTEEYDQIDISTTIAHWLNINMPTSTGKLIKPLIKQ